MDRKSIAFALAVVAFFAYRAGVLDRPLSKIGLNRQACVISHSGTQFCAAQAKSYCLSMRTIAPTPDCEQILDQADGDTSQSVPPAIADR